MKKLCVWRLIVWLVLFCGGNNFGVWATSLTTTAPGGDPLTGYQEVAPTFSNGDRVRGHVMFKQGFTVDAGATVTWDADGIVNGPITFTDDTSVLRLATDLRLGTTASFPDAAVWNFGGNNRTIVLGSDITLGSLLLNVPLASTSNLTIDGQNHTLTCRDVYFKPSTNTTLTLKNLTLVYEDSSAVELPGHLFQGGGIYIFDNVTIRIVSNSGVVPRLFLLSTGSTLTRNVTIRNRFAIEAPNSPVIFADTTTNNNTTTLNVTIDKNATFYVGKKTVLYRGDVYTNNFVMTDQTSALHFDGCDFYTGSTTAGSVSINSNSTAGLTIKKGMVFFENKVRIFNMKDDSGAVNTNMTNALNFGDGSSSANNVDVRVLGGAYVIVAGCMKYNAA